MGQSIKHGKKQIEATMDLKIVICGVGGQGILFFAKILHSLAILAGEEVLGSETHGMSQRGGSVVSHVKIGNYASPMVQKGTADLLFSLEAEETYPHLAFLKKSGRIAVNAHKGFALRKEVLELLEERKITVELFDAGSRAGILGAPAAANLVLLSHAIHEGWLPFTSKDLENAVRDATSPSRLEEALAAIATV